MKKLLIAASLILAGLFTQAQFSSANLTASGLTCAMCTRAIYNALGKIPQVDKIETDIKNSSFIIKFKEGSNVDPDILKKAVEDAGFSVAKFQLHGNFGNSKIEKDTHLTLGNKVFHFINNGNPTSIKGEQTITVVDKNYLSKKDFKKYEALTSYACLQTGKTEKCCAKNGVTMNERIYHVTL